MSIPEFQSFIYPFLNLAKNGQEHSLQEVRGFLDLSVDDKAEKDPRGTQTKFDNRIYWTKSYFVKARLLECSRRARFIRTERGLNFLNRFPHNITVKNLKEIDEFKEFSHGNRENESIEQISKNNIPIFEGKRPIEKLEESYQIINSELAEQLLKKVKDRTWQFFEDLIVDLMVEMGYGGSRNRAGEKLKRRGDGGVDGIINEDKLGLDLIYLQAKRWTNQGGIGRPEIQEFVGALHVQRAKKGVFITTSYFARAAYDYVQTIGPKVILIDGVTLANLMIENNVGTSIVESYQIKKVDLDYFER